MQNKLQYTHTLFILTAKKRSTMIVFLILRLAKAAILVLHMHPYLYSCVCVLCKSLISVSPVWVWLCSSGWRMKESCASYHVKHPCNSKTGWSSSVSEEEPLLYKAMRLHFTPKCVCCELYMVWNVQPIKMYCQNTVVFCVFRIIEHIGHPIPYPLTLMLNCSLFGPITASKLMQIWSTRFLQCDCRGLSIQKKKKPLFVMLPHIKNDFLHISQLRKFLGRSELTMI